MRLFILIFCVIFRTSFTLAQNDIKPFQTGDKAHISVDMYDNANTTNSVVIGEGSYNLVYKYNWTEKGGDNKDSIKNLEKIISKIKGY